MKTQDRLKINKEYYEKMRKDSFVVFFNIIRIDKIKIKKTCKQVHLKD